MIQIDLNGTDQRQGIAALCITGQLVFFDAIRHISGHIIIQRCGGAAETAQLCQGLQIAQIVFMALIHGLVHDIGVMLLPIHDGKICAVSRRQQIVGFQGAAGAVGLRRQVGKCHNDLACVKGHIFSRQL